MREGARKINAECKGYTPDCLATELNKKEIVALDEERKAAMVSNLLVILCGDKEASPVVNTGTLSH